MKVKLSISPWLLACLFFSATVANGADMPDQVGTVTRIQGQVIELPQGFGSRPLRVGSPVHAQSKIKTGPNARLEIRLIDESTMTLGEWAHATLNIKLEDYLQDRKQREEADESTPEAKKSKSMIIDIFSGTFRYVTGLFAKLDNQSVQIGTQVATIGVRGTDFFGGPLAAGMPPGEIHYGFMILDGAIDVKNRYGDVTLDSPKEGTFLPMKGHKAPTPPSTWKQPAIDEAFASIAFD